jgi:hypothetical protein
MSTNRLEDLDIRNTLTAKAIECTDGMARTELDEEANAPYTVPLTQLRTWDALATNLPGTSANDDLGLYTGSLATDAPTIETGDCKTLTATRYARFQFPLPVEYVSGGSITVRINGGMKTTVAGTSAAVDVETYLCDRDGAVGSDLCSTAAQSINNLTLADKDFVITPTGLNAGDMLDIRVAIAIVDAATGTAVIGKIGAIEILLDVQG